MRSKKCPPPIRARMLLSSSRRNKRISELIAAINPVYLVAIAVLVAAGCAFEVAYASRGAANSRTAHVASRNGPYSVRSI